MADAQFEGLSICCIHFYRNKTCPKGDNCAYLHKSRVEVDSKHYRVGDEFFYGQVKLPKNCIFFNRGFCKHQQNCRFLHYSYTDDSVVITNPRFRHNNRQTNIVNRSNPPSSSSEIMDLANDNVEIESNHGANIKKPTDFKTDECTNTVDNNQIQSPHEVQILNDDQIEEEGACASPPLNITDKNESWNPLAPEFVPKNTSKLRSYAEALGTEGVDESLVNRTLCPYVNKDGICRNLANCTYLHGELCDMCSRLILHPYNEEQRKRHRQECLQQHEKNMELSFAIARSKEKSCGVCFEIVMEKASGEQRFGILPNCNHCFCLSCIRKWRQARQFDNKIIRACPECRVTSDFVCPSTYWVDTKEDKDKVIEEYKKALSRKDCKYFKKGQGKCPFGNKCFYLHAFPDGSICDVGPPPRIRRRNGRSARNDISVLQQVMLWDFFDDRDFPWQSVADDLEDLVSFFTDSDESDWSDYELFLD